MQLPVKNYLTLDIEEWFRANYSSLKNSRYKKDSRLVMLTDRLIKLCAKYQVKSTCFVVGSVARNYPEIVERLSTAGHEIASQSDEHKLIYGMTPKEFALDLRRSCRSLEKITHKKVLGFRAPSWSVREPMLPWYYEALVKQGLTYSSSVFPIQTFLYGIPDANPGMHKPLIYGQAGNILEIPSSSINFLGKRMGFAGGFYLRAIPYPLIELITKWQNSRGVPVIFYLHPREIDPNQTVLQLPFPESLIHYYGIEQTEEKLEKLLERFGSTMHQTLGELATKYNS